MVSLFNHFADEIFSTRKSYQYAVRKMGEVAEDLEKCLTNNQKKMLEQLRYYEDRCIGCEIEQSFVYGFSMAFQLKKESNSKHKITTI